MIRAWKRFAPLAWLVLLTACAHKATAWMPDASIIPMTDAAHAGQPDCRALAEPSPFRDGPVQMTERPTLAFGCATYSNLARMLANPGDLRQPAPYAGQDGVTAGAAVGRYHDHKVTPLQAGSTTGSLSGAGGAP